MDAMNDRDLIETFLQGDADAFSQIFEKYYGEALRMAYLITNNRCDSEYVVQDAFIRCYEKLPSLKNPEKRKIQILVFPHINQNGMALLRQAKARTARAAGFRQRNCRRR